MGPEYKKTLERALQYLCKGADAVCDGVAQTGGVPRLNYMNGSYSWDSEYVWDSWANFQWAGFLAGRMWLLHALTKNQQYADAAMHICERIGPVLAKHPTVFSSTGLDMYYALTLGYKITNEKVLKDWALAGGDNFANIFDRKAGAFLQIANADRIVIDTGLNLPSMLWASQWEPNRGTLAYQHLDTVLKVGLVRDDGSNCHAAALDPESRAVTGLFSLQGWTNESVWARGQGWAMLGFAHGYEASGRLDYLDAARRAADWYVENAPSGWVPRYDYNDPQREALPYDSCAACIATAVLMRLARWLPDRAEQYRKVAQETLKALIADFLTVGGVVLHGTWGRMRHIEPGKPRLGRFPQEDVMPYGNYWIAECLFREMSDDWSVLSLKRE
ncbi:glycoside hydrolase family 88 protein [Burkholderia sp. L27(2015)]|uniref:glycoside hydrolase family 88 protein n=1 Tax=Burkholderia sp. L27(2015) TaxID=1641858 RepID=UPI00131C1F41|nr:glycoside hydrolase family 88 protein [Burkholderia sp. L27(2015)]